LAYQPERSGPILWAVPEIAVVRAAGGLSILAARPSIAVPRGPGRRHRYRSVDENHLSMVTLAWPTLPAGGPKAVCSRRYAGPVEHSAASEARDRVVCLAASRARPGFWVVLVDHLCPRRPFSAVVVVRGVDLSADHLVYYDDSRVCGRRSACFERASILALACIAKAGISPSKWSGANAVDPACCRSLGSVQAPES